MSKSSQFRELRDVCSGTREQNTDMVSGEVRAAQYKALVQCKIEGKSCGNCSKKQVRGLGLFFCSLKKKSIQPYNICGLHVALVAMPVESCV